MLNPVRICIGCGRSSEEIAAWPGADDGRRREISESAARRLEEMERALAAGP